MTTEKNELRNRRRSRIRKKVQGTGDRPRLTVYRSLTHIYAQVVDDEGNRVLASANTLGKAKVSEFSGLSKKAKAQKVGTKLADLCKQKGIDRVVFDRNGYRYQGRVQALADSAREAGLQF